MNLEEASLRNKFTMSMSAEGIGWAMGNSYYYTTQPDLTLSPWAIAQTVARLIGITVLQLMEPCRKHAISHPRQVAMMLVRDNCPNLSLPAIAQLFQLDYKTVYFGIRSARARTAKPGDLRDLYLEACRRLSVEPSDAVD